MIRGTLHTIDEISNFFAKLSRWAVLCMVLLTAEQVLSRYLFNSSSIGLQELQWHLFGVAFLFSSAYCLSRDQHVRVDIVYSRLSTRAQAWVNIFGTICFLVPMCALLIYYGIQYTVLALSVKSTIPPHHFSEIYLGSSHFLFPLISACEEILRNTLLLGEISPNPGGLEARWLIKAAIPIGFALLLLQGLAYSLKHVAILLGISDKQGT